jgi:hypothetical protein
MLKRAQVAKRLGKSIATVRRLEGVALHPIVDTDGVHRFDPEEVERVRRGGAGGASSSGRSAWLRAQLHQRTLLPTFDEEDDSDEHVEDDDAADIPQDEADWCSREAEVARREERARERERDLAERERQLAERRNTQSREHEPTAADAMRADPEFRAAMRAQVAQLIDDLDHLPRRVAAKVLNEADLALLEAVLRADLD